MKAYLQKIAGTAAMIMAYGLIFCIFCLFPAYAFATENFVVSSSESNIVGSIRYLVIGHYIADFRRFRGEFLIDRQHPEKNFVDLHIEMNSIISNHPGLDNIVKSNEILDTQKYPFASFRSTSMIVDTATNECTVFGNLTLHGVTKAINFIFTFDGPKVENDHQKIIARGLWRIRRKDFDIIWKQILDVGGIILSNYIDIKWVIVGTKAHTIGVLSGKEAIRVNSGKSASMKPFRSF